MGFPAEMKYRLSRRELLSLTGRTCLGALLLTAIPVHAEEAFQQQLALERGELFQPGSPSSVVSASNPGESLQGHPV